MQTDLSAVLRNSLKPLKQAEIKCYMLMLLKGVMHCHENHIIHRDLKPGISFIGSHRHVKIKIVG
jgi:serine/threonine protein kinase